MKWLMNKLRTDDVFANLFTAAGIGAILAIGLPAILK
jgi:hypothetical protein